MSVQFNRTRRKFEIVNDAEEKRYRRWLFGLATSPFPAAYLLANPDPRAKADATTPPAQSTLFDSPDKPA